MGDFGPRCYRFSAALLLATVWLLSDYSAANAQQHSAIFTIDVESGETVKISHKDGWWLGSASLSHDGKKVVYVGAPQRGGNWHILVESLDLPPGAKPEDREPKDLGPGDGPCWSVDDEQILLYFDVGNRLGIKPGVWVMNADGTGREWLCEGTRPRWSPDGDRMAMVSAHEGFPSIFIFDTLSLEQVRVLDRGYDYLIGATWSPDGKQLAYTGYKNGGPFQGGQGELAIVDAAAGAKPEVVAKGDVGWHPDWSPDGKHIVFWFHTNQQERLHLLEVGSGEPPRLLPGQSTPRNSDPVWSFDSKKVAFSSDR